ncbi:uncharacterized protein EHS24_004108 [Apiotrichum porosum]|uniref:Uncharacterized protein n=1 Tax=Apiotrichum porosum TaxID=105984 RepID=A0A427Y4B9_9TREE|nr:uncharacterized protein EHS24_004108 [Apiotrichum porosum]RSH85923.1 hypothetical protein EHS24_004108 [Apiotrichum porosum]
MEAYQPLLASSQSAFNSLLLTGISSSTSTHLFAVPHAGPSDNFAGKFVLEWVKTPRRSIPIGNIKDSLPSLISGFDPSPTSARVRVGSTTFAEPAVPVQVRPPPCPTETIFSGPEALRTTRIEAAFNEGRQRTLNLPPCFPTLPGYRAAARQHPKAWRSASFDTEFKEIFRTWATTHHPDVANDIMGRFQPADGNPDEALVLLIMHWPPESDTTVALSEQRQGSQTFIRAGFNLGLLISYYNFLAVHLPTQSQLKDYDNVPELTRKRLNRGTSDIKRAHAKHIIERCKRSGLYQMTIVFGATCRDMLAEALKMAEADNELVVEEINICYRALLPIEMGLPCEETTAAAFCHTHDNAPSAATRFAPSLPKSATIASVCIANIPLDAQLRASAVFYDKSHGKTVPYHELSASLVDRFTKIASKIEQDALEAMGTLSQEFADTL